MQKWGKHIAAVAVFLVLTVVYFAPAVFEGKSIRQGDMEKAVARTAHSSAQRTQEGLISCARVHEPLR